MQIDILSVKFGYVNLYVAKCLSCFVNSEMNRDSYHPLQTDKIALFCSSDKHNVTKCNLVFHDYVFLSVYLTDLYTGKSQKKKSSKFAHSWD